MRFVLFNVDALNCANFEHLNWSRVTGVEVYFSSCTSKWFSHCHTSSKLMLENRLKGRVTKPLLRDNAANN
jgi:hypothetical protein